MSYVVVIRVQLEGDPETFCGIIEQYRRECLGNESGMEQFLICKIPGDEQGFLLVEAFVDEEAHWSHTHGKDLANLLKMMEENDLKMAVMMLEGEEILSSVPLLN